MTHVALQLRWAGRGLARAVVYDANDLAHSAAAAGVHGGTPVSDDRFRLCTAALAEDFSNGRHKRLSPDPHVPPPGLHMPRIRNRAQKSAGLQGCKRVQTHSPAPRGGDGTPGRARSLNRGRSRFARCGRFKRRALLQGFRHGVCGCRSKLAARGRSDGIIDQLRRRS